jgi:hypothetical protein
MPATRKSMLDTHDARLGGDYRSEHERDERGEHYAEIAFYLRPPAGESMMPLSQSGIVFVGNEFCWQFWLGPG